MLTPEKRLPGLIWGIEFAYPAEDYMRKLRIVLVALAVALVGATVSADSVTKPFRSQQLTPEAGIQRRIHGQLQHARQLHAVAVKHKDTLKSGCIANGLVVVQALTRVIDDSVGALRGATSDADRMIHRQAIDAAVAEADRSAQEIDACVGVRELRVAARDDGSQLEPMPGGGTTTTTTKSKDPAQQHVNGGVGQGNLVTDEDTIEVLLADDLEGLCPSSPAVPGQCR